MELATTEFNSVKDRINSTVKYVSLLLDDLAHLREQANQITPSYVREVARRSFSLEISIVKNATFTRALKRPQTACVNTANRDMKTTLFQGW